jgi:hypothetical protein
MRIGFGWAVLPLALILHPGGGLGADTVKIGGMTISSWHVGKWFASCTTDKTENSSTCDAELNAFDLPEPKHKTATDIDRHFHRTANRVDIQVTAFRGACIAYIRIDRPHLRMNPATVIKWRSENMSVPYAMRSFRDVAGQRVFFDDGKLSLQRTLEHEPTLYIKTIYADRSASFSVSTKGYKNACQSIVSKARKLNSHR